MSSYTAVRIGTLSYGGSQGEVYDSQAGLFNTADMVRVGTPDDEGFERVYRITVDELRRRLEALGYSLEAVRVSMVEALTPLYASVPRQDGDIPYRRFLDFACTQSVDDLIGIVRDWCVAETFFQEHEPTPQQLETRFAINIDDFPRAIVALLQGGTPLLVLSDTPCLYGHAFERLLCEAFDDDTAYELDVTEVAVAGYYEGNDDPVGNAYDAQLAQRNLDAFVLGSVLPEEESETLEFKAITSANVCESIADQVAKYIIGFLNQTGGRVLFGIGDDGRVEGIRIRRNQRDDLHRRINAACVSITPAVALRDIRITFRPVIGAAHYLEECFVVEISVPQGPPHEMFFRKDKTWVRFGKETRALAGHALFTHILSAYRAVRFLETRPSAAPSDAPSSKIDTHV